MKVTTMQQWNQVNACCCEMDLCPEPLMQCLMLTGSVESYGFFANDSSDGYGGAPVLPWKIYRKEKVTFTYDVSFFHVGGEDCDGHLTFEEGEGSGLQVCTTINDRNFCGDGWLGNTVPDHPECDGPFPCPMPSHNEGSFTFSGYYNTDYCAIDGFHSEQQTYEGVYLGGVPKVGVIPEELWPPCTPGYNYTDTFDGDTITSLAENVLPYIPGVASGWVGQKTWEDGKTYDEWVSETIVALRAAMADAIRTRDFDACDYGSELTFGDCDYESYTVTPGSEPETGDETVTLSLTMPAEYSFCVPAAVLEAMPLRVVYDVQWDVAAFPPDGDDDAPQRLETNSWSWDGDRGSICSPRHKWPEPPYPDWTVRIVNLLSKCWHSARIGDLPTVHGETYPFPP